MFNEFFQGFFVTGMILIIMIRQTTTVSKTQGKKCKVKVKIHTPNYLWTESRLKKQVEEVSSTDIIWLFNRVFYTRLCLPQ